MVDIVPPRFEDLRVRDPDNEVMDAEFFDRRNRAIATCLAQLATRINAIGGAEDTLVTLGLSRINEVLGPSLARISAAAEIGFLCAESSTVATLALNTPTVLTVSDGDGGAREVFKPTPFVSIVRAAQDAGDEFATARVVQYVPETGALTVQPIYISPALTGSHNDWVIAAAGATIQHMVEMVETAQQVQADLEAAQTDLDNALALIQNGAVVSVNGKTGVVVIGMGDISGLVTALAGKASSSHGHTIAEVTNLQTSLDGKAATGHGHTIENVTGLQTALDGKAATGHNHDASYAAAGHNHDGVYQPAGSYASSSHNHAGVYEPADADILKANETKQISKGFTLAPHDLGNKNAGWTIDPANGNYQYMSNTGAHTITAPASDCAVEIEITNSATAGAISFSGFTGTIRGDAYNTTNGNRFTLVVRRINGQTRGSWIAWQ